MSRIASLLVLSALLAAGSARAADVGQHPAVFSPRPLPAVDANTFIPAHPALKKFAAAVRPQADHPAVQARLAAPSLDAGRFLVQPPATTRWTLASDALVITAAGTMPAQR